jgi:hypothetical protein
MKIKMIQTYQGAFHKDPQIEAAQRMGRDRALPLSKGKCQGSKRLLFFPLWVKPLFFV